MDVSEFAGTDFVKLTEGWDFELFRIPAKITPALEARLQTEGHLLVAWLQAIRDMFPDCTLIEVVRGEPGLFPAFLRETEASSHMKDCLVPRRNGQIFVGNNTAFESKWQKDFKSREAFRAAELDAFRACRFQEGFASQGMLCNEPPIPLRVLDFLEAQDHRNISLVCKVTHQAAHRLFTGEVMREVPAPTHPSGRERERNLLCGSWFSLASLGQETPEHTPAEGQRPLRQSLNTLTDTCPGRITWFERKGGYFPYHVRDLLTWRTIHLQQNHTRMHKRQCGSSGENLFVLEAPQLKVVQEKLAEPPVPGVETEVDRLHILDQILELVNAAISMGDNLILRDSRCCTFFRLGTSLYIFPAGEGEEEEEDDVDDYYD